MIDPKIIKIASYTNNAGLKNKFTHKSYVKNSLCGDKIKMEFIIKDSKIKSVRYETDACILCEASASLLSRLIKNLNIQDLIKEIEEIKKFNKTINYSFPKKFRQFKKLLNKNNIKRINCVILPMDATLKAFKTGK